MIYLSLSHAIIYIPSGSFLSLSLLFGFVGLFSFFFLFILFHFFLFCYFCYCCCCCWIWFDSGRVAQIVAFTKTKAKSEKSSTQLPFNSTLSLFNSSELQHKHCSCSFVCCFPKGLYYSRSLNKTNMNEKKLKHFENVRLIVIVVLCCCCCCCCYLRVFFVIKTFQQHKTKQKQQSKDLINRLINEYIYIWMFFLLWTHACKRLAFRLSGETRNERMMWCRQQQQQQ